MRRRRGRGIRGLLTATAGAAALVAGLGMTLAVGVPAAQASTASTYTTIGTGRYPIDVAVSADGATAYVVNRGDGGIPSMQVIDVASGAVLDEFDYPANTQPGTIELSPNGSQVWVGFYGDDPTANPPAPMGILVYQTGDLTAAPTQLRLGGGIIDIESNGAYMYAAGLFNPVYKIDDATLAVVATANTGTQIRGIAVDPAGTTVYTSAHDGTGGVIPIDAATMTVGTRVVTAPDTWSVGYNAPQDRVYAGNDGSPASISAFTPGSTAVDTGPLPCGPRLMDVTPGGQRLYVSCLAGGVFTYDYTTGAQAQMQYGGNVESVVAYGGPDSVNGDATRVFVTSGADDRLLVFDKPTVAGFTGVADQSVRTGNTATFTVEPNNFWQTLQWQSSTDGGATWTDVAGATATTLTVDATTADNGTKYRLVASSGFFDDVVSDPMTLTVTEPPSPTPTPTPCPTDADASPTCLAPTGSDTVAPIAVAALALAAGALLIAAAFGRRLLRRR
ncbi:hypothetical protein ACX9R5_03785 [Rathayibacter sp. CAU 1779]